MLCASQLCGALGVLNIRRNFVLSRLSFLGERKENSQPFYGDLGRCLTESVLVSGRRQIHCGWNFWKRSIKRKIFLLNMQCRKYLAKKQLILPFLRPRDLAGIFIRLHTFALRQKRFFLQWVFQLSRVVRKWKLNTITLML